MSLRRWLLAITAVALLFLAAFRTESLAGGQSARSHSLPGHEDLSFWVNHDGLMELDFEGEVGFGDMARLLMRRRANRETMRGLRDRFTFPSQDIATLETPDAFRIRYEGGKLHWLNTPEQIVMAAGRVFNLPLILINDSDDFATLEATLGDAQPLTAPIRPKQASAYLLRLREPEPGQRQRRLLATIGSASVEITLNLDVRPTVKLRVTIEDDDGSVTPARVYLTAADGLAYAPPGSISRFAALPAEQYFHADGSFEIELPAGETTVEVTRGQEYRLARKTLALEPEQSANLLMRLERWDHPAANGWYSADAHIHANYTAPHHQVITPEDVRLQTLAEDLNNANLMVANSGTELLHDESHFEGRPHRLSRPSYVMYWNEEMRNAGIYGHMSFFNLTSLVHPIYTGFKNTPHPEDYPPNYAQAKAAQDQGGAVTYVHPGYGANLDRASARELPVDLALGVIDAMDVISNNPEEVAMELWYRLLNCGFRLAVSAGTDAFTNVADHYTPGGGRVYAQTDGPMDYAKWIAAYKRGRSFATNGPIIRFTLDSHHPGDELTLPAGAKQTLRLRADVRSQFPLDTVDVIINGEVAISRPATGLDRITIDEPITLDRSSWIAVRALGPWHRLILNDTSAFAHTSPVYVRFGDQPVANPADLRFYREWIDGLIAKVEQTGKFTSPDRRQEVIELFQRARERYADPAGR
jgi:TolB protein